MDLCFLQPQILARNTDGRSGHYNDFNRLNSYYWVASIVVPVGKWVGFVRFLCFLFFSVSGRVSPITPLLSGVFVRRVFRAYFGRISRGSRKA